MWLYVAGCVKKDNKDELDLTIINDMTVFVDKV